MKTIFKESILERFSQEISIAEMNGKRISYFEITEEEKEDLKYELKCASMVKDKNVKLPNGCFTIVYNIPVYVKDEIREKTVNYDECLTNIVKSAIDLNRFIRKNINEKLYNINSVLFAKEFQIIHINTGRRTGKTTTIKRLAKENDVIIVPNDRLKTFISIKTFSINEAMTNNFYFWLYDRPKNLTFWLDEVGLCSEETIDSFYSNIFRIPNNDYTVVRLGK